MDILEHHNIFARSVRSNFQVPSVIRLRKYVRHARSPIIRFSRENVYLRDDHSCQYCGEKFSIKELTLDHIIPASHGGRKSWLNVVAACRPCNQAKGSKTPEQANMPLLKKPMVPTWLPDQPLDMNFKFVPASWKLYLSTVEEAG